MTKKIKNLTTENIDAEIRVRISKNELHEASLLCEAITDYIRHQLIHHGEYKVLSFPSLKFEPQQPFRTGQHRLGGRALRFRDGKFEFKIPRPGLKKIREGQWAARRKRNGTG
jgi:hypothetical protein